MQTETIRIEDTVASVLKRDPGLSRVFERAGIDYCCGGGVSLDAACRERGIHPETLLQLLKEAGPLHSQESEAEELPLSVLADHIESTHHAYMHAELPRIVALVEKVAMVHGGKDGRLIEIRNVTVPLTQEMAQHMMKEETVLFPMIRSLDASDAIAEFHCGSLANPIRQMLVEHREAEAALVRLRELTENYAIPAWACGTYRAMLDALSRLDQDLVEHIAKEEEHLFPRALEEEQG